MTSSPEYPDPDPPAGEYPDEQPPPDTDDADT